MLNSDSSPNFSLLKELRQPTNSGRKVVNLIGRKFGRLTPLGFLGIYKHNARWLCRCDCGKFVTPPAAKVLRGATKSCGCYNQETLPSYSVTHGQTKTPAYKIWCGMHVRCYNPKSKDFTNYGQRGIAICERWHKFENFLADMGQPPKGMFIERVNNELGYSPENCKWATKLEQARNTRTTHYLTMNGETLSMAEWAERYGIPYLKFVDRINNLHWAIEEALELVPKFRTTGARTKWLTVKGETLPMSEWCRRTGVKKSALRNRLKRGWTLERALGLSKS